MFLGIDLGTSAVKIILIDEQQQLIANNSQALSVSRPKLGWSEQNPQDWWQATQQGMQELKQQYPQALSQVTAIGLSGQMHGATLIDSNNQPLRPTLLWDDSRASAQCDTLQHRVKTCCDITGNLIVPGFTAPKVLWVAEHEAEIFQQIHKVLLPKDYLRLCITGSYATDLSDASGTSWLDVGQRQWSQTMLAATGLQLKHMPELFEGTAITATVLPDIATLWGIPKTAVVVAGGGDNAASAISMGVINPGEAFLSLGTSGVYFVADDHFRPNPTENLHTMCHCIPKRWHQMSVTLSAASCLTWLSELLRIDVEQLLKNAEQHKAQHTPIFMPYLSGERTPHNDPHSRGVFFGITHETGAAELAQAILEGVAFALADGQQVIEHAGVPIREVSVIGGGARSQYWGKILASVLQRELCYREQAHVGGAFGAARLAWASQKQNKSSQQCFTAPPISHKIYPTETLMLHYQHKLTLYRELYTQLRQSMAKLAAERQHYD